MAADSAIIVLIDIFRLLARSGVIAALLSTQTPAASDHSINHEPPAMDQRWPQNSAGNGCSFAALHMSACGTKRTWRGVFLFVRFWGEADMHRRAASSASVATDPKPSYAEPKSCAAQVLT
jgi:hypothetical protein